MGRVISVVNEKGGVGKTSFSVQLGHEFAHQGYKTLLIDNDPSGDATAAIFGQDIPETITNGSRPEAVANTVWLYHESGVAEPVEVHENLFAMGATDALTMLRGADMEPAYTFCESVDILGEGYDVVIIDCPPSFGLLFTAAILATRNSGVLIPALPDELAFKAACKVDERITQMNRVMGANVSILGVLMNRVVTNPLPQSARYYLDEFDSRFGSQMLSTHVHQTVKMSDALALQDSLRNYAKGHKVVGQIESVTKEIVDRLGDLQQ